MSMMSEFKEFAVKGNVMDLAVGVIIGGAFGKIFGGLDFSNYFVRLADAPASYTGPQTYDALTKAGVPLFAYGNFITVLINFIILAFIIFWMVKLINSAKKAPPPAEEAPPSPDDVLLLREIRDALKGRY